MADLSRLSSPARPLRVLFVHPSYPNTFHWVVDALAGRPGLHTAYMIENSYRSAVRADTPRVTVYGFDPDGEFYKPSPDGAPPAVAPPEVARTYDHLHAFERGARRGAGVAAALRRLAPRYRPDVIVGYASSGCTLYLREVVDAAIISYCEHPGYHIAYARKEFPASFEQYQYDVGYRAMILACLANSDLGLVASEHARRMFPPEFQPKVRSQSEGFPVPALPDDIAALRARLGLPAGIIIGFFGRSLEAVRGFDIFLHVAKRIRAARPDVGILVIGNEQTLYGNEGMHLGDRSFKAYALDAAQMDPAEILWRDFLPYDAFLEHLACLDLAILPTFEGASNWSFFDAMAAATPILSSNRSYVPELVTDGEEGYLFDPYDVDGYVRAALALLDQPGERARLGRNARERILRCHTPERAADGYERIIREAYALRQAR